MKVLFLNTSLDREKKKEVVAVSGAAWNLPFVLSSLEERSAALCSANHRLPPIGYIELQIYIAFFKKNVRFKKSCLKIKKSYKNSGDEKN